MSFTYTVGFKLKRLQIIVKISYHNLDKNETEYIVEACAMLEAIITLADLDIPPLEVYIKTDEDGSDFIFELLEDFYDVFSELP